MRGKIFLSAALLFSPQKNRYFPYIFLKLSKKIGRNSSKQTFWPREEHFLDVREGGVFPPPRSPPFAHVWDKPNAHVDWHLPYSFFDNNHPNPRWRKKVDFHCRSSLLPQKILIEDLQYITCCSLFCVGFTSGKHIPMRKESALACYQWSVP